MPIPAKEATFAMAGIEILNWIFMVCALAAPMIKVSSCGVALFQSDCPGGKGLVDSSCDDVKNHFGAVGAFGIIVMLIVCVTMFVHIKFALDAAGKAPPSPLDAPLEKLKPLLAPIHGVCFFCLFLCWAIAAGGATGTFCGLDMTKYGDLDAAFAMFFLCWLMQGALAGLCFLVFGIPGKVGAATSTAVKPAEKVEVKSPNAEAPEKPTEKPATEEKKADPPAVEEKKVETPAATEEKKEAPAA